MQTLKVGNLAYFLLLTYKIGNITISFMAISLTINAIDCNICLLLALTLWWTQKCGAFRQKHQSEKAPNKPLVYAFLHVNEVDCCGLFSPCFSGIMYI